jgi:hypothetical protein
MPSVVLQPVYLLWLALSPLLYRLRYLRLLEAPIS